MLSAAATLYLPYAVSPLRLIFATYLMIATTTPLMLRLRHAVTIERGGHSVRNTGTLFVIDIAATMLRMTAAPAADMISAIFTPC